MHENAGNIGDRVKFVTDTSKDFNVNVLIMTYRGYDPNEGKPTEEGLKMDADAINAFLKSDDPVVG